MAEKTRIPPSTDLLMKDANTAMSDRAKRINSLHKKVDQIVVEENRKRRQVSTEVDSLSKQKERLRRELEYARTEISHDMAKEYGGVVKGLGKTIHQLSIGVKNITMTTAKATSDAVSQYGKAISEDISINKTNMMAMALAKTSPLFGYFASKFMETDVFKGAAARIRDGLGSALVSGIKRVSGIIPGIEGKREKQGKREREISALTGEIGSLKKEIQGRPPAMQVGGFVRKGGVVEVHAAEVITPVDKLLREISTQIQIQQAAERRGFVKTFVKEFQQAKDSKQENWQDRMLKSLIELKIAFIGTTSRLRIAWQRTLLEHPTFRGMLMFAEGFKAVIGAPIKWLFGARGGYLSDIKRASATDNVFLKTSNILGLIYTMGMPKLDAIAKYTRATATAVSGVEPSEPLPTRYSMFQRIGAAFRKQKKTGKFDLGEISGKPDLEKTAGKYGLHAESLREAGFGKDGDISLKNIVSVLFGRGKRGGVEGAGDFFGKQKERKVLHKGMESDPQAGIFQSLERLNKKTGALLFLKRKQEKREGPHSPSMADNIKNTYMWTKKQFAQGRDKGKEQFRQLKKIRRVGEKQNHWTRLMNRKLRKMGGNIWKAIMFAFTMFQGVVSTAINAIGILLSPLLSYLGIRGLFRSGPGGAFGKYRPGDAGFIGHGKKFKDWGARRVKGAKRYGKGIGRAGRMAGPGGAASYAGRGAWSGVKKAGKWAKGLGGAALRTVGRAAGPIAGIGMGVYDAAKAAIFNPEGFAGGFITRAFAAFLGGTKSGAKGALWGAAKGAAIGMLFGPIGAAIGAGAGIILGFIGGKNLSKAFAVILKPIKLLVKAIWAIITFPFRMIWKGIKLITAAGVWIVKKLFMLAKGLIKGIWAVVTWPIRTLYKIASWWYENITKPIYKVVWGAISAVGKRIWAIVTWPYRMLRDMAVFLYEQTMGRVKEVWQGIKAVGKRIWSIITFPLRMVRLFVDTFLKELGFRGLGEGGSFWKTVKKVVSTVFNVVTWPLRMFWKLTGWIGKGITALVKGVGKVIWEIVSVPWYIMKTAAKIWWKLTGWWLKGTMSMIAGVVKVMAKIVAFPFKVIGGLFSMIWKGLKGIWAVISFPFKVISEVTKFIWGFFTRENKNVKEKFSIWKGIATLFKAAIYIPMKILSLITWPFRMIIKLGKWAFEKIFGKGFFAKAMKMLQDPRFKKGLLKAYHAIVDPIMLPLRILGWIGRKIGGMFAGLWDGIKDMWNVLTWPFRVIPESVRDLKNWIVKKVTDIPFIGRFIKGIRKMKNWAMDIHSGTFAEKRLAEQGFVPPTDRSKRKKREPYWEKRKRLLRDKGVTLAELGASEGTYRYGMIVRAKIGGKWYSVNKQGQDWIVEPVSGPTVTKEELSKRMTAKFAAEKGVDQATAEKQTAALMGMMGDTSKDQVNATQTSTNILNSSVNNVSNSNNSSPSRGRGSTAGFSSGGKYASDVENCNIT